MPGSPVRLKVPSVQRGFKSVPCPDGSGRVLVIPRQSKHRWTPQERPLRSVILNADGTVASSGLPKFGGLGEWNFDDHRDLLTAALRDGQPLRHSRKLDGSLMIRSVIDGEVVLRTRGTFDGGELGAAARQVAADRHPRLLDPAFEPDRSLLMEFTSPQFRIILAYPRPQLTLIGAVCHHDLRLADWPQLEDLAEQAGVALVDCLDLPANRKELEAEVARMQDQEGVVVRLPGGQVMIKLKSRGYLTQHRLRFLMDVGTIRELCERHQVRSLDEFAAAAGGADWEVISDAAPYVQAYVDAADAARRRHAEIDMLVLGVQTRHPGDRKACAREITGLVADAEVQPALLLLDGREDEAQVALMRVMTDQAYRTFASDPSPAD